MVAYGQSLAATSKRHAPWYIIPADDKENARLIVARILLETMEDLNLKLPPTTPERKRELQRLRRGLSKT